MPYDAVAQGYDEHFRRPCDRWEDERLIGLLRPLVVGKTVLDLGCGTGFLLDHLRPAEYVGIDASEAMLIVLEEKHDVGAIKATVGEPGWASVLAGWDFDTIVATWAADYFADLPAVLAELVAVLRPGGAIALHGTTPRGHRRRHFVDKAEPFYRWTPTRVRAAAWSAGLAPPAIVGGGATPDPLATRWGAWAASLAVPPGLHYSMLARW